MRLLNTEPWVASARCRCNPDQALFFPEIGDIDGNSRKAREICAQCIVWRDCLDYALSQHDKFGIWGGLPPKERRLAYHYPVRKCIKCGFIHVFTDKEQKLCESCLRPPRRRHVKRDEEGRFQPISIRTCVD